MLNRFPRRKSVERLALFKRETESIPRCLSIVSSVQELNKESVSTTSPARNRPHNRLSKLTSPVPLPGPVGPVGGNGVGDSVRADQDEAMESNEEQPQ